MATHLRTSLVAIAIATACTAIVTLRTLASPGPTARAPATEEERHNLALKIAASEEGWTNETTQNFPMDQWSQRDDFHGREFKSAVDLANKGHFRIEDVLRAVDDDIHSARVVRPDAPDRRNARAVPCKPRPVYD
jgi:hypothetical protein